MTAGRRRRTAMDRRYGSRRWKQTRLRVLHRDLWRCFVPECPLSASVADHIIAVYPEMPDSLFFDEMNLRAFLQAAQHRPRRSGSPGARAGWLQRDTA
jgi:5-methylcytosine-specific restriction endonuclease McrA